MALFQLTQQNIPVAVPGTGFSEAIGEARSRGVELDAAGRLTRCLSLIAAYAFIDAKITRGDHQGKRLFSAPRHAASLRTRYDLEGDGARGWSFGAGAYFLSQRQGDSANTFQLPGFARVDLMARYRLPLGKPVASFQPNANNLARQGVLRRLQRVGDRHRAGCTAHCAGFCAPGLLAAGSPPPHDGQERTDILPTRTVWIDQSSSAVPHAFSPAQHSLGDPFGGPTIIWALPMPGVVLRAYWPAAPSMPDPRHRWRRCLPCTWPGETARGV